MILLLGILVIFLISASFHQKQIPGKHCYMFIRSSYNFQYTKSNNSFIPAIKYLPKRAIGREQKIPYSIVQTNERDEIPRGMSHAISTIIEKNPEFTYRYYNSTERRDFIKDHFDKVIVDAYDKLEVNAFKADFFRLLIVYLYGGCYIDSPFTAVDSLISAFDPAVTFFTTLDGPQYQYFLNSALFCSIPGHPALRNTLSRIMRTIAGSRYESDPLAVTGPRKLGRGYKQYSNISKIEGEGYYDDRKTVLITRESARMCSYAVMKKLDGEVLMLSRYPDYEGDMRTYTNLPHYHILYNKRLVYNRSIRIDIPKKYQIGPREQYITGDGDYHDPKKAPKGWE